MSLVCNELILAEEMLESTGYACADNLAYCTLPSLRTMKSYPLLSSSSPPSGVGGLFSSESCIDIVSDKSKLNNCNTLTCALKSASGFIINFCKELNADNSSPATSLKVATSASGVTTSGSSVLSPVTYVFTSMTGMFSATQFTLQAIPP